MSIIAKFPWHRGEYYTVLQRDHLFEALKSSHFILLLIVVAIETLRISMRKRPLANLNPLLLERLVRTGLLNVCFTERQKLSLLHVSGTPNQSPTNQSLDFNLIATSPSNDTPMTNVIPKVLSF
jgi:hypothetical protein